MDYFKFLNLIKDLFEKTETPFEYQTPNQLLKLIHSNQSHQKLLDRYTTAIEEPTEALSTNSNTDLNYAFFECRLHGYPKLTKEEIDTYCTIKNLNRKDYSIYALEELTRNWISQELSGRLLNTLSTIKRTQYGNIFLIHKSESSKFFNLFRNEKHIEWGWSGLSTQKNFDWTEDILEDGKPLWDWDTLSFNEGIVWTFELVDRFKEFINWGCISSYNLNWDIKTIQHFKDYIVFKGSRYGDLKNAIGKSFNSERFRRLAQERNLIGNISANQHICWTDELISTFEASWDWTYLSQNESIDWTERRIDSYKSKIDFPALSKNKGVKWNHAFIVRYADQLSFHALTKNPSVIWSTELIERYQHKLNFVEFSRYANIACEAIIAFEKEWDKTHTVRHNARRNSDGAYWYTTTHSLWEYLCLNENIIWNDKLINQFLEKIPLNALNGNRVSVKVETINKHWNYHRNEMTDYWETYDGDERTKFEDIYFKNKIKYATITDLTFEKILENEIRWFGILNSPSYLNKSIKHIIKNIEL